ncbi:TPA: restriction endonuclease subunit S [Legionella pneumophila]|nr:restriction endonuclease subunit S [Legionella pneumophila]HDO7921810.1 restriction endonuclease subunit S [Legionella pneumophila]HDO7932893.1 restriction endonuclease subunit S [Legionella pneumophila]HDO8030874.1 restriction endonuclease subunit S [Legionella pneumophila]HDO8039700.1 restriction endonuclease subunit S [Legionella pneumophila]
MNSEWKLVKLKDYTDKIASGATPRGGSNVYFDIGNYCLIRSQNIYNKGFEASGLVYIDDEAAKKLKNVDIFKKDILLNITGDSVARVCIAPEDYLPARVNQHVALIRLKHDEFDYRFVRYFLTSNKMQSYMLSLASSGGTRNALTKGMIENFLIPKPALSIQKKIAHILSTLDNKIELNKKINQTLESIAQAIFKSWFVDFDPVHAKANAQSEDEYDAIAKELGISREILDLFPSEFEESELGLIPKGWEVDEIGNIINIVGGGTPSTKNKDFWDGGNVNWSTPKDLSSLDFPVLLDTERKITEQGLKKISSGLLEEGTLLLSSRAPIGYMAISKIPVAINQGFIAIPPNQKLSSIFLLYWTKNNIDVIKSYSGGTTFQEISKKNFRLIKLILPSANLLDAFNKLASNLFNSIVMKEMENKSLQEIRDNLLPKLLSGEIDVSNLNLEPEND